MAGFTYTSDVLSKRRSRQQDSQAVPSHPRHHALRHLPWSPRSVAPYPPSLHSRQSDNRPVHQLWLQDTLKRNITHRFAQLPVRVSGTLVLLDLLGGSLDVAGCGLRLILLLCLEFLLIQLGLRLLPNGTDLKAYLRCCFTIGSRFALALTLTSFLIPLCLLRWLRRLTVPRRCFLWLDILL